MVNENLSCRQQLGLEILQQARTGHRATQRLLGGGHSREDKKVLVERIVYGKLADEPPFSLPDAHKGESLSSMLARRAGREVEQLAFFPARGAGAIAALRGKRELYLGKRARRIFRVNAAGYPER